MPGSPLLIAGVVFVLFGLLLVGTERRTADGTKARMRPGPTAIGVAFLVFGLGAAAVGLRQG